MKDQTLHVRSAALTGFAELVYELGGDPIELLRAARIEPAMLEDPDQLILHAAFVDLLEIAAVRTQRPDFGLRLSRRQGHAMLGPVGLLIRQQPSVRQALLAHARYLHLHAEGIRVVLEEHGGCARVTFDASTVVRRPATQMVELALAVGVGMLRVACGPRWTPSAVFFTHAPPTDTSTHDSVFRAPVFFDRDFDGLEFPSRVLDVELQGGDANLQRYLLSYVDELERRHAGDLVSKTRTLISGLLGTDRCNAVGIARTLGMDVRTLQRRLEAGGAGYRGLLDEVRASIAAGHVAASDKPLSEIAELLGYSQLSAFSRSFNRWFSQSPSVWRAEQRALREGRTGAERTGGTSGAAAARQHTSAQPEHGTSVPTTGAGSAPRSTRGSARADRTRSPEGSRGPRGARHPARRRP